MKLSSIFGFQKKEENNKTKKRNWPSKKQWAQFFAVLNKKERIIFLILLFLFFGSAVFLTVNFYCSHTEIKAAGGGSFVEGVVGSPRFINPIYSQNSDVDRDLVEIIFSSLVPDLAEEVRIQKDGEIYEISLKQNVFWHDGEKLTADDVIFTIKTIQNPDYKSPLRANYLGIDVEKLDEYTVRFKLNNPYSAFNERLNVKIMPEHIWKDITPQNFLLTNYNLKPIGSGPYQFKTLKQNGSNSIVSLELVKFKNYFEDEKPYLSEISFRFYDSEKKLTEAAQKGEVDGFSVASSANLNLFKTSGFNEFSFSLPRYFAIFFNPDKSRFLADENIRKALNYATDKEEIVQSVLAGRAIIIDSPILPETYGYESPAQIYAYDTAEAEILLEAAGLEKQDNEWLQITKESAVEFKSELKLGSRGSEVTALQTCLARYPELYPEGTVSGYFGAKTKEAVINFQEKYSEDILAPWGFTEGTGTVSKTTRAKLNEVCSTPAEKTPLKFTLITVDDPALKEVALAVQKQWGKIGVNIEIKTYSSTELTQNVIKTRDYEMLLFGEALGEIPDPYPFWHSSQVKDPGLNLAKYENSKIDTLLESARISLDEEVRAEKYQTFQDLLIADAPCVFLYQPDYVYFTDKKIKGGLEEKTIIDPSKRFDNIENWYTKQKRIW